MTTPSAAVNTKAVKDRRPLAFASFDEVRADVRLLLDADARGSLRRLGNWTLGQNLHHLAAWIGFAYDGVPIKPPWLIRLLGPLLKNRFLSRPLPAGFRLGGVPAGTLATEDTPAPLAAQQLFAAIDRLEREAPTRPNPVLGTLTHDQWKRLHLNHAALHLSFLHPR